MKAALAWLARTGFVYLLLFAAIAFFVFAWPTFGNGFSAENLRQDTMSVSAIRDTLGQERDAAQDVLEARVAQARGMGSEALDERIATLRTEHENIDGELDAGGGWLDSVRPSRILAMKRLELRRAALDAELAALEAVRDRRVQQDALGAARGTLARYATIPTENAIRVSRKLCAEARDALAAFDARQQFDRVARNIVLQERAVLADDRDTRCANAESRADRRRQGLAARQAVTDARAALARLEQASIATLPDPAQGMSDTTLRDIAWRAFLALLAILLVPFAIRTLFYYVLAPLVERGPPVRLAIPSGMSSAALPEAGSRPTLTVELEEGEELLVRQSYLQSSPTGAEMRTQWLLSWRNILTSLASGMVFLTRGRGAAASFGISARNDPFAEIARIELASGDAMVMQPRALAAIVQPTGRPMPIRSRWRLFNLHAWLTFQLRYLVFHGPGALIVKGGRGVRIEPAAAGRRFGQDQLVGFSAHTAYTVTRTETFLPYFFGREPLFLDRVADTGAAQPGILVIEEAPMAGRRTGVRSGLEGAFDAMLKAFGI